MPVMVHDPVRAKVQSLVEAVVAELGYVPEANGAVPPGKPAMAILLVHDGSHDAAFLAALAGAEDALAGQAGSLAVLHLTGGEQQLHDFLMQHRPEGVLLLPPFGDDPALAVLCETAGCACIRLATIADPVAPRMVCSPDRRAACEATAHLIAQGHTRIGFVAGPGENLRARERELGFLDAMAEHGLDFGAELVAEGDCSLAAGREAGLLLLEASPRPSAILAANAEMAIGVLQAALESGIAVPQGLSIMAAEDSAAAAQVWPPLTAMQHPYGAMAQQAVLALTDPQDGLSAPVIFPARLVRRATVLPILNPDA